MGPRAKQFADALSRNLDDVFHDDPTSFSGYGYIKFIKESLGDMVRYGNVVVSPTNIKKYKDECDFQRMSLMSMLSTSTERFTTLLQTFDRKPVEQAAQFMEGSASPIVLYILFRHTERSVPGTEVILDPIVKSYEPMAIETLKRYPGCINGLPEEYREVLKGLV